MQTLPKTRQTRPVKKTTAAAAKAPKSPVARPHSARKLAEAFKSFTCAAGTLEESYARLQGELARLREELSRANQDLEASLQENQRMRTYLAQILAGLPCGVLVLTVSGELKMANRMAGELFDLAPADSDGLHNGTNPDYSSLVPLLISGPQWHDREYEFKRASGEERVLAISRAELPTSSDSTAETVFTLLDVTEVKRLEKERETSRRTQALADMAMLLAHEIRNPLGSLELFAGLLADSTSAQPLTHQWANQLQAGLRTLSATVNNVLQFHSEPSGLLVPTNLARLLEDTLEFLQPLARQAGVRTRLAKPPEDFHILSDPHRLQQVFFNLTLNAFRAMPASATLEVSVAQADREGQQSVEVRFKDEGSGIPEDHLPHIFEAGFTTAAGSPGLGLAVSKRVVEQHKGTIHAESVPGEGATFILTFPRVGAER
jgi:signal transduction histidine kinase